MSDRRIVATGFGARTPLGRNYNKIWERVKNGETSIRDIRDTHPELEKSGINIGSLFATNPNYLDKDNPVFFNFDYNRFKIKEKPPEDKHKERANLFIQLGLTVAADTIKDAGLEGKIDKEMQERAGVVMGIGMGSAKEILKQYDIYLAGGKYHANFILKTIPDAVPGSISKHWKLHAGDSSSISTACASGASALRQGARDIKDMTADMMFCGGLIEAHDISTFLAFKGPRTLSKNKNPDQAMRPFDKKRNGLVIGEGASMIVLEELGHAEARGATIYGELVGYSATSDSFHEVAPDPEGTYAALAMQRAIDMAGITPDQVDYLNAHGTSTKLGDAAEINAIKKVFGDNPSNTSISSTKGGTSHMLAATSNLESLFSLLAIRDGVVPLTRNYEEPDKGCDLDFTPETIEKSIRYVMSNAFGFFGHNVCLLWKAYEG